MWWTFSSHSARFFWSVLSLGWWKASSLVLLEVAEPPVGFCGQSSDCLSPSSIILDSRRLCLYTTGWSPHLSWALPSSLSYFQWPKIGFFFCITSLWNVSALDIVKVTVSWHKAVPCLDMLELNSLWICYDLTPWFIWTMVRCWGKVKLCLEWLNLWMVGFWVLIF